MTTPTFKSITLSGKDAAKFLQGQLTVNVDKLSSEFLPCAISDLKGRVAFGLWACRLDDETFTLITAADCADGLSAHIKKYGAFSKFNKGEPAPIYPTVTDNLPNFSSDENLANPQDWAKKSIETGNYWITAATQGLFQPQELRLHQRGGVDYDKGCYLGQEIIARLWFKAAPKAYLHRVLLADTAQAGDKIGKVQIVNILPSENGYDALVVGASDHVNEIGQILPLPDALMGSVARG